MLRTFKKKCSGLQDYTEKLKHSTQQDAVNKKKNVFTGLHCKMNHSIQQDLGTFWFVFTGLHCKLKHSTQQDAVTIKFDIVKR
jgi:uncharacterized protein YoaH (UPF0181 family)